MLVTPILLLVGVAVIQLVLALTVRATLESAAVEGARAAALSGSSSGAATARVRQLLDGTVAESALLATETGSMRLDGMAAIETRIDYQLTLLGMLVPAVLTVEGHVLVETAR